MIIRSLCMKVLSKFLHCIALHKKERHYKTCNDANSLLKTKIVEQLVQRVASCWILKGEITDWSPLKAFLAMRMLTASVGWNASQKIY